MLLTRRVLSSRPKQVILFLEVKRNKANMWHSHYPELVQAVWATTSRIPLYQEQMTKSAKKSGDYF